MNDNMRYFRDILWKALRVPQTFVNSFASMSFHDDPIVLPDDFDPWSSVDFDGFDGFDGLDLEDPSPVGPLTPLGISIREQRQSGGLCPECGVKGPYINLAPVCGKHGPY